MIMAFGNFTYLVYMFVFSWLPIFLLWTKYHNYLKKHFSVIAKAFSVTFPLILLWDVISVFSGVWDYSHDRILGIYISFMPLEEILLVATSVFGASFITVLFYEYLHQRKILK